MSAILAHSRTRRVAFRSILIAALLSMTIACVPQAEREAALRRQAIDLFNEAERTAQDGQLTAARDLYWKSIEIWPLAPAYFGLGGVCLRLNQYRRAERFFAKAAEMQPGNRLYLSQAEYARSLAASAPPDSMAHEDADGDRQP